MDLYEKWHSRTQCGGYTHVMKAISFANEILNMLFGIVYGKSNSKLFEIVINVNVSYRKFDATKSKDIGLAK